MKKKLLFFLSAFMAMAVLFDFGVSYAAPPPDNDNAVIQVTAQVDQQVIMENQAFPATAVFNAVKVIQPGGAEALADMKAGFVYNTTVNFAADTKKTPEPVSQLDQAANNKYQQLPGVYIGDQHQPVEKNMTPASDNSSAEKTVNPVQRE